MAQIMIRCPQIGKTVLIAMASFQAMELEGNSFSCPACRGTHTWNKSNAFLVENMDKWRLGIYLKQIETLCDMALVAAEDIASLKIQENTARFWNTIQAFLSAGANISKLLWPANSGSEEAKQKARSRAEELKKLLSIEDDSPLRPRSFRDHFEHSDERLDSFVESQTVFIDRNVSYKGGIVVNGKPAEENDTTFRHFDSTELIISFRQDSYNVKAVSQEFMVLREKVQDALAVIHESY